MLLVVDVGNTNVVLGVYEGERFLKDWRIRTDPNMTNDEFCVLASHMFSQMNLNVSKIDKIVIASVVPPVNKTIDFFCQNYVKKKPHWVSSKSPHGMAIRYTNPDQVGVDRIVNAMAAFHKYRTSLIVIDFGTATTFDAVSEKGEYLGGAISPGLFISAEALYMRAPKLPRIELSMPPENVIGKDTFASMRSGIIFGYAGLVDGMVNRMKKEMGNQPKIVATGGLSRLMHNVTQTIESIEPDLTLEGLRLIAERLSA